MMEISIAYKVLNGYLISHLTALTLDWLVYTSHVHILHNAEILRHIPSLHSRISHRILPRSSVYTTCLVGRKATCDVSHGMASFKKREASKGQGMLTLVTNPTNSTSRYRNAALTAVYGAIWVTT